MKKIILPLAFLLTITACNNSDKKKEEQSGPTHSSKEPKTLTDSLMAAIDDGHIVGMSKIGKLHNTQKQVQAVIDSIGKLPAKAKQAAAPYLAKLQGLVKDLEYADFAMDKWMTEFDMDSAVNNMELRIKYLTDEKLKVGKMKEAILGGLQKADSLLKEKF